MDPRPHLLLIDDDAFVAAARARLLESSFRVEICSGGAAAAKALERIAAGERFDVVICNGQMPHLRGVEFYRRARLVWREIQEHIVFLSDGVSAEDAAFIDGTGAEHVAASGDDGEELARAVHATLARARARLPH